VLHSTAWRAAAECALNARDGLFLALDERFHSAVEQIHHPPRYAFTHRGVAHEPAEANALHTAADDKPARDTHLATTN
jgi:hypothetical protein